MINLKDNDFDIFGFPCQFELDSQALSAAYLRLQGEIHPDRFANASAQEKRLAMQWATRINEAYKRLQNPIERAIYWCELNGENPRAQQSSLPTELLMQQIDWREQLEETDSQQTLRNLIEAVSAEKKRCMHAMANYIDQDKDAKAACNAAQGLLFIDKFMFELNKKLEQMEDAS